MYIVKWIYAKKNVEMSLFWMLDFFYNSKCNERIIKIITIEKEMSFYLGFIVKCLISGEVEII